MPDPNAPIDNWSPSDFERFWQRLPHQVQWPTKSVDIQIAEVVKARIARGWAADDLDPTPGQEAS